ncbi:exopolyphosphatase [Candidatus Neomarinimicrobiota bacterium]
MRVVYRGDFDGTVCAAMLLELDLCDELVQAHPTDIQNRKIAITNQDIICNLPHHPDCHMWFDHHSSEIANADFPTNFEGSARITDSAAALVYEYFEDELSFLGKYEDLVDDANLYDAAILTLEQILNPTGNIMLAFLLDSRTSLGLAHDFTISNREWATKIPELMTMHTVDEILAMPDSIERIEHYQAGFEASKRFYMENSYLDGNVIVTDVRGKEIPVGNRFLLYTLPGLSTGNISVRIADGHDDDVVSITIGHSIFNKTSPIDVGILCKSYGGGGHTTAGACQPPADKAEATLRTIIMACKG